ncbi:type II secretion system protein [Solibacillus sp. CAU 1738]|uniref:type IV pilus modification PilV family protein n=1 Tax=Solibacillus sp. CAU 1738 TaxID=3140363 RepID=UPI003260B7BF
MKQKIRMLLTSQRGFSLIEVVASIVIITIVLISFSQLFVQSNKTAAHNNEKLVTVNLADAALVKLRSETFTKNSSITNVNDYFVDNVETDATKKKPPREIKMNGKTYSVSYVASQSATNVPNSNNSEKDLNLIKVVVTVTAPDGKIKGSSEGYVSLE